MAFVVAAGSLAWAQAPTAIPPESLSWRGDPSAPDLSGVWMLAQPATPQKATASREGWSPWPPSLKAPFADLWRKRLAAASAGQRTDDPIVGCMPAGMPRFITGATGPLLIIQSQQRVTMYRDGEGPRRIWLDGRQFPAPGDVEPFLKGTAIGHYEGSDLLIESIGFKDQPIDSTGAPHSDQLKIDERYHRLDKQTLRVDITLTDAQAYAAPLKASVIYKAVTDPLWRPHEFICTPNTDYHPERYIQQ